MSMEFKFTGDGYNATLSTSLGVAIRGLEGDDEMSEEDRVKQMEADLDAQLAIFREDVEDEVAAFRERAAKLGQRLITQSIEQPRYWRAQREIYRPWDRP